MARSSPPSPSFSARRRWGIFFSVLISIAAVLALVVMVNYLGARYFLRFNWNAGDSLKLSQRTLGLLQSITNDIKVVIYYDKGEALYTQVNALLNEYHLANPKISVQTVDYVLDAATARRVQAQYKLTARDDKDQIIFDSTNHFIVIPGKMLWEYGPPQQVMGDGQVTYNRELKAFHGEEVFGAALQNAIDPRPLNAGYLIGHREHVLDDARDDAGYWRFKDILGQNNISVTNLILKGTNTVPADCSLLIIAGPRLPLEKEEAEKIRQYLAQGGRLFALFRTYDGVSTGLEQLLAEYGIDAGANNVTDSVNTSGGVIYLNSFNPKHPISSPLQNSFFAIVSPRSLVASKAVEQDSDPATVTELAWTGANAILVNGRTSLPAGGRVPVIVASEKAGAKAGLGGHAPTRIVAVGDSMCLENDVLAGAPDRAENGAFAALAVNWLLDRPQLMAGIAPHPMAEYRLAMTNSEINNIRWIFLAAMPGGVLALGFLVWLRRRR